MFDVEAIDAEYFTLDEFKFKNGEVLKDAEVEYITFGTPQYDDNGIISNAVIYFHGSSGSCYQVEAVTLQDAFLRIWVAERYLIQINSSSFQSVLLAVPVLLAHQQLGL